MANSMIRIEMTNLDGYLPGEIRENRKKMNKMMFKNDQYVLIIETLVSIPQCHGIFSTITRIDWSFDVLGNM